MNFARVYSRHRGNYGGSGFARMTAVVGWTLWPHVLWSNRLCPTSVLIVRGCGAVLSESIPQRLKPGSVGVWECQG